MSFNRWKGLEDHRPLGHVNEQESLHIPMAQGEEVLSEQIVLIAKY